MSPSRVTTPDVLGSRAGRAIGSQKMLGALFLVAVAMATVGERGLPSPRRYAAIVLLWFIFGLAAELGGQVARFTGALAALVTLAMTMGRAGQRTLGWLQHTAGSLGEQPVPAAAISTPSPAERAAQGRGGPLVGSGSAGRPRTAPSASSGGGGGFGG